MTQQILRRESASRTLGGVPREKMDGLAFARPTPKRGLGGGAAWLTRLARNFAPQDWYIAAYFAVMTIAVVCGTGPGREHSLSLIAADVTCLACGLALTRGEVLKPGAFPSAILYRLTVWLTVFLSYFQLRHILPAVSERAVDRDLLAFDLRVFHVEPSLAWDKFVTPVTTEWFAFFYFGYFFLLSAHVLSIMLAAKSALRLAHFALGIFLMFCTGHLVYMLVPGYGPYWFLASDFQHELTGGPFWRAVQATVSAGGAQKDIFPSLHTACPTYFALFSYRYRRVLPYKYTWMITAFSATQIIVATMFLRWHYLIDIVAGITLAVYACTVGEALVVWDAHRRERLTRELGADAVQANFELLDYSWAKRALGFRVADEERAG
jgi:hypothetical protein